jgi:hypothetical protein
MPPIAGLSVVRSSIHGYGVIATRDFHPGELVAVIDGFVLAEDDPADDRYALWLGDRKYFDMLDQTRWINHSCDPNVYIDAGFRDDGSAWAHVIALCSVRTGDELAYDYAFPANLAERCFCNATRCRGWIVDADDLDRVKYGSDGSSSPPESSATISD